MKIKFEQFLRESVQPEVSRLNMTLYEIFDIYLTYEDVVEFLNKELKNRKVFVSDTFIYKNIDDSYDFFEKEYLRDVTIDVEKVELAERTLTIIIFGKDGINYHISENTRLKWEKPITRKITDLDPYGEEEED